MWSTPKDREQAERTVRDEQPKRLYQARADQNYETFSVYTVNGDVLVKGPFYTMDAALDAAARLDALAKWKDA